MGSKSKRRRFGVQVNVKLDLVMILLVLFFLSLAWVYFWHSGALNADIKESVASESESVRAHVTECSTRMESKVEKRADEIERQLEQLDAKLDLIDAKLDKLTRLISPPMPDGLKRADAPTP